jgi:hypothetical protein
LKPHCSFRGFSRLVTSAEQSGKQVA